MPTADKRGYTLVEMMVVVAIFGILSIIAVAAYRGHLKQAKLAEATDFIKAIDAAEANYYHETGVYADISAGPLTTYPQPTSKLGAFKTDWGSPPNCTAPSICLATNGWQRLEAAPTGAVYFGYSVVATSANSGVTPYARMTAAGGVTSPETLGGQQLVYPSTAMDWYSARAIGNMDGAADYSGTNGFCVVTHQVGQDMVIACN